MFASSLRLYAHMMLARHFSFSHFAYAAAVLIIPAVPDYFYDVATLLFF